VRVWVTKGRVNQKKLLYRFQAPQLVEKSDRLLSLIIEKAKASKKARSIPPSKLAPAIVSTVVPKYSEVMLRSVKSNLAEILEERRSYKADFDRKLLERWQKPLDLLEVLIEVSLEAGGKFNSEYRGIAAKSQDYVFEVLIRLHSRACQTSHEILCLLEAGLADGAHARWRTLHEIAVISLFIKDRGQEIAKRYLHYGIVETYRELLEYQKHCLKLGHKPPTDEELHQMQRMYDEVVKTYGHDFTARYGWIPRHVLKDRAFSEIEKSVRLDKLRPYYMMACHNVHSGPKGIQFRLGLGLLKGESRRPFILAGPSIYGLSDPGQSTAISLGQITTCLLSIKPTLTHLITMDAIAKLVEEINQTFCEVQSQIEKGRAREEAKAYG